MTKAYEVMTKSLATCRPDDNAAYVANIMKERDIGNVLVVEDGMLLGIVTDRDLAINALTDANDMKHAPISNFMSRDVITGNSQWSLNKVAKTMAKNQIRRLPIVEEGEIAGIISLGDIARHYNRMDIITNSLKEISKPDGIARNGKNRGIGSWIGLSLLALSSAMMAWFTWSHTGKHYRNQVMQSKPYHVAADAVNTARDRVVVAAKSKTARNLQRQFRSSIRDLSEQLPTITYKPPKRKGIRFS